MIPQVTIPEHGYIIGLFSIRPDNGYSSQGINKKWIKETRYDYYFPEFAHLSERTIKKGELFYSSANPEQADEKFGYTGIYDEYRNNENIVTGGMRNDPTYRTYAINRIWSEDAPELNSDFLECKPDKKIFAYTNSKDDFQYEIYSKITAMRPMPKYATPRTF